MLSYKIEAESQKGGKAIAQANNASIFFDASSGRMDNLPNPAELLLISLAACMLKNVERFSEILKYDYTKATIEVNGLRNDSPPFMKEITYQLKIASNMDQKKLNLLHINILKFGTITNTIAKVANLSGTIQFL